MNSGSESEFESLIIKADSVHRTYHQNQNPDALFKKAMTFLEKLRIMDGDNLHAQTLLEEIHEQMLHTVYGSNRIESAGLSLDSTLHTGRQILNQVPSHRDEYTTEHETEENANSAEDLRSLDFTLRYTPLQDILRGQREVV